MPSPKKIVLYYADWCPHCKDIKPEWDQLTNYLRKNTINGKTIDIQKFEESSITGKEIQGFPTVKITDDKGVEHDCYCERKAEAYIDYLKKFGSEPIVKQNGGYKAGTFSTLESRYGNMDKEDFYKMKYYKYKAKIAKLMMQ